MATNNTSSSNPRAEKMGDVLDVLSSGIAKTAANEPKFEPQHLVYIGIAAYKGQHFPGEHDGIITQELWETVQTHLKNGTSMNKARLAGRGSAPSLLRGLLFSEQGRAFTPGWTRKQHKTYRYYINTDSIKIGKESCDVHCRKYPARTGHSVNGGSAQHHS